MLPKTFGEHIVARLSVSLSVRPEIVSGPLLCYLKLDFKTISQKYILPCWHDVWHATFVLLPWRSSSQHDLSATSCLAHNFVILIVIQLTFFVTKYPFRQHHPPSMVSSSYRVQTVALTGCKQSLILKNVISIKTICHDFLGEAPSNKTNVMRICIITQRMYN